MKMILNPPRDRWQQIIQRPQFRQDNLEETVTEVFNAVKEKGNQALIDYTLLFDNKKMNSLAVSRSEIENSANRIPEKLKKAINLAKANIQHFHKAQKADKKRIETTSGVVCWQESRPIEKIGFYIPGGNAPLFSTVLMLGIPAIIAGCSNIVMCTPPGKNGKIPPEILYAASLLNINNIFAVGGIQAIAAMTYGTESIPGVYKIFGPGNQYVTAAKQMALRLGVAIDLPAGPSELMVLAGKPAYPAFIAADLLSQAEHGPDSQIVCIAGHKSLLIAVEQELKTQLTALPEPIRAVAAKALSNSMLIRLGLKQDRMDFINAYAPEHLIITDKNASFYIKNLLNAGSVFIGNYTPESAGDYASGTNHTLPTNGYARSYSGLNLDAFIKKITFQKISKQGLANIGPAVEIMARAEGLPAHSNAVRIRLNGF